MWWSQLGIVCVHLLVCCILVCSESAENAENINYRLSDNIKPSLYLINIRVDLLKFEFDGSVSIELTADKETSLIEIHKLDLHISPYIRVFDEKFNRTEVKSFNYIQESEIFQIHLKKPLLANKVYDLKISFEGEITNDMKGLYLSPQYEDNVVKLVFLTFQDVQIYFSIKNLFFEDILERHSRPQLMLERYFLVLMNQSLKQSSN